MKRFAAVLATAGLLMSSLVTTASAEPAKSADPPYTPPPIEWGACTNPRLVQAGAQCGFVEVPLDYAKPGGTKIKLAVSRIRHKTPDSAYQGPMLVNPGGPGGSGLIYSLLGRGVPNGAGDAYDWIGFDPRGVGASQPALSCDPDYGGYNRPPYVPIPPSVERTWLDRASGYAEDCARAGGDLLNHIKTVDSVKDMESIRKALGAEQINYYGFSYGTYLGQVYGTMFPERFRRVVFDGVVNPAKVWYQSNLDQNIAFEKTVRIFFDWVAKYDHIYRLGNTGNEVMQKFYVEQVKLTHQPAAGKIGPAEWTDIFLQAGYYVFGWEDVAEAFSGWMHNREAQPLIDLYGTPPFTDNGYAIYLAVECTDQKWPTDWNKWRVDNWRTFFRAPFETWGNAWFNAPCAFWKGQSGTPSSVDGSKVKDALLISETLDAATPYEGALEVRKRFPGAVLIEGVGGTTHSGSLSGIACTDNRIAEYLQTGALPPRQPGNRSDVQCEPVPQPDPDARSVAAAPAGERLGPVLPQLRR